MNNIFNYLLKASLFCLLSWQKGFEIRNGIIIHIHRNTSAVLCVLPRHRNGSSHQPTLTLKRLPSSNHLYLNPFINSDTLSRQIQSQFTAFLFKMQTLLHLLCHQLKKVFAVSSLWHQHRLRTYFWMPSRTIIMKESQSKPGTTPPMTIVMVILRWFDHALIFYNKYLGTHNYSYEF